MGFRVLSFMKRRIATMLPSSLEPSAMECLAELYQISRALLPDPKAAEDAVEGTYAVAAISTDVRLSLFSELMRQIAQRRRWSYRLRRPFSFLVQRSPVDPLVGSLHAMPSPQADVLVLTDVCDFHLFEIALMLGRTESECAALLRSGRAALEVAVPGTANSVAAFQ